MTTSPLPQLRKICLKLPGATEVPAWGTSTFRCPKIFAMYAQPSDEKHSKGRPGVWLKAAPGNQEYMVRDRPDRFYVPPYVGVSGWVGVFLDRDVAWGEVAMLVEDAWRLLAPKKVVKAHDEGGAIPAIATVKSRAKAAASPAKRAAKKTAKKTPKKTAKKAPMKSARKNTPRKSTRPPAKKK